MLIFRLLALPLVPTLVGGTFLLLASQRIGAARTPATSTWCGDPALVELLHVRLHGCEIGQFYGAGRDVWVGLHRPTALAPSVIVHFDGMGTDEIEALLRAELAAGTLDVVRTSPDVQRVTEIRHFPELAAAVFVGDWRADGGAGVDPSSGVMLFFGFGLILADVGRLARWLLRRLRGR